MGHTAETDEAIERTIILTFVEKAVQERLLAFVGKPRARDKLRRELLDPRRMSQGFITTVPATLQTTDGIWGLLAKPRPPADCYLVSENVAWDASRMPLRQALDLVVGSGWSTLVCCHPERLLYFEGEAPGLRAILSTGPR
jgi:hypothetical protein